MKIVNASYEITDCPDGQSALRKIERIGRVCWKSEDRITETSNLVFVESLIHKGHESVLEHVSITVEFVCDRGVSHELVRHRLASFTQESTRYCNYANGKFNGELTFIKPCFWNDAGKNYEDWKKAVDSIEQTYMRLIALGCKPEQARSVLPNSLATRIVMTANLREWRHVLKLRTAPAAHPQMRELMVPLLRDLQLRIPVVFDDVGVK